MSVSSKVPGDQELYDTIERTSQALADIWPGMITAEEVAQAIWQDLLENPGDLEAAREIRGPALREFIEKRGARFVAKEKEDYDYFTGNFFYSTQDVRNLLKRGALVSGRERTWTERQDLDIAFQRLRDNHEIAVSEWEKKRKDKGFPKPLDYAAIIWANYVLDQPIHRYRADLMRAVDALTREMNRVHFKTHNPERFRQKPSNTVTIRNKYDSSVNYTRELTEEEWALTASTYAKDLAIYNESRPYGGPGSRTIKIGMVEEIDPEKISDVTEDGTRVVEPEIVEDMD